MSIRNSTDSRGRFRKDTNNRNCINPEFNPAISSVPVANSLPEFIHAISSVYVAHSFPEFTPAINAVPVARTLPESTPTGTALIAGVNSGKE
jgi:hypothetical protein